MNEQMNELPEISFKEKKEKKKRGFIPWLKQKLGIGSRGPIGSTGPSSGMFITAGGIGVGGAGFFRVARSRGFSGLLAALLASKVGRFLLGGLITVALGIGTYMAMKGSSGQGILGFKFDKSSGSYLSLTSGGKSEGSSLDMLMGANKGFLSDGVERGSGKKGKGKGEGGSGEGKGYGPSGQMGDGYGPGGIGKGYGDGTGADYGLGGIGGYGPSGHMGDSGGLASYLMASGFGTGTSAAENKLRALGGFANNLGQGAFGSGSGSWPSGARRTVFDSKTGKSSSKSGKFIASSKIGSYGSKYGYGSGGYSRGGSGVGGSRGSGGYASGGSGVGGSGSGITGGKGYTVGGQSHSSLTSMTSQKIPDYETGDGVDRANYDSGFLAWDQSREIRDTQNTFTTGNIDRARAAQDKAWEEGQTSHRTVVGDVTLETGCVGEGCGIVTPIDADTKINVDIPETPPDVKIPDPKLPDTSPVEILAIEAMTNILIAAALALAASIMVRTGRALMSNPYTFAAGLALFLAGIALAIVALGYAIKAFAQGIEIMTKWKQPLMGSIYTAGAGVAMLAAGMAMAGMSLPGGITVAWLAAGAGFLSLLGQMLQSQITNLPDMSSISDVHGGQTVGGEDYSDIGEEEVNQAERDAEAKRKQGEAKDKATESRISSISTKKGRRARAIEKYKREIKSQEISANEKAENAKDKAESEREKAENTTGKIKLEIK